MEDETGQHCIRMGWNMFGYDTVSDVAESKVHFACKILTPIRHFGAISVHPVKQDGLILLQNILYTIY